jgi:chromosome segregation ATPase
MLFNSKKKDAPEIKIDKIKSEEKKIEIARKKAQEQVDGALAEVARLQTVAKEIEHANKVAQADYDEKVDKFKTELATLVLDKSVALIDLEKAKSEVFTVQTERDTLSKEIKTLKEALTELQSEVDSKKADIQNLSDKGIKMSRNIDIQINHKEGLLTDLTKVVDRTIIEHESLKKRHQNAIDRLMEENTKQELLLKSEQAKLTDIVNESKTISRQVSEAEDRFVEIEKNINEAQATLDTLNVGIKDEEQAFDAAKKEVEIAKAELKTLTLERINSKNFAQELLNKERTIKKMYSDVGLEYK